MVCLPLLAKTAVGEWRTHFSYNNVQQVIAGNGAVFAVANGKLFTYNPQKRTLETFSTLNGLHGQSITQIGYSEAKKTLVVVYSDGNIDLLNAGRWINVPDFSNKPMTADKTVNGLRVFGQYAFLSTGVGLLILDLDRNVFTESYYLGTNEAPYTQCTDAFQWGDSVLVVTERGLYQGDRAQNLQDFSYWKSLPFVNGVLPKKVVRYANRWVVWASNRTIYLQQGGSWSTLLENVTVTDFSIQDGQLMACDGNTIYAFDSVFQCQVSPSKSAYSIAYEGKEKKWYVGSGVFGMIPYLRASNGTFTATGDTLMPQGPHQKTAWNAFFHKGIYYAPAGGRWGNRYFYDASVATFDDAVWSHPTGLESVEAAIGFRPMDYVNMAIDPKDDSHYFISSWGDGLFEFRNHTLFQCYTEKNSPLRPVIPGRYCRVDGATFDEKGNLWVLNSKFYPGGPAATKYLPDSALLILRPDGSWFQPYYPTLKTAPTWNSILFTKNGQVWMNAARERYGIFVLDTKGTLEDLSDDKTRAFDNFTDQDNTLLSPWYICCMAEDSNGTVWIGTNAGPILATGTSNVFNSNYRFTRVKIPRNDGTDNADYLLKDIRINCIAIDGGNRKWLGTEGSGLYVLSPDGLETIHHFTTENSPLPSDYIWSVALNPESGEAFIGTDEGLVSYRSEATEGASDYGNVRVFPNPVLPEYTGQITVTGLMKDTQIRITDLNGNLIVKGTSVGGQFCWNGYLSSGQKAASGVYLVLCASEDGAESLACKFMLVR
jgi:hypothetical protein